MASTHADADDCIDTDVYYDGTEVAVRGRSQHSDVAHVPATDDAGNVVFDADGDPVPKCDVAEQTDTDWVLRPVRSVINRDKCRRCFARDEVAKQNKANGGSTSFARKIRSGDWNGADD